MKSKIGTSSGRASVQASFVSGTESPHLSRKHRVRKRKLGSKPLNGNHGDRFRRDSLPTNLGRNPWNVTRSGPVRLHSAERACGAKPNL